MKNFIPMITGFSAMLFSCFVFAENILNAANTSWILTSTALVLFMTRSEERRVGKECER